MQGLNQESRIKNAQRFVSHSRD